MLDFYVLRRCFNGPLCWLWNLSTETKSAVATAHDWNENILLLILLFNLWWGLSQSWKAEWHNLLFFLFFCMTSVFLFLTIYRRFLVPRAGLNLELALKILLFLVEGVMLWYFVAAQRIVHHFHGCGIQRLIIVFGSLLG